MEMFIIKLAILAVLLGLMPAFIARSKGRDFMKWWAYGALAFAIALPHSLLLSLGQGTKRCMYCGKQCKASAAYCKTCGYEFM